MTAKNNKIKYLDRVQLIFALFTKFTLFRININKRLTACTIDFCK